MELAPVVLFVYNRPLHTRQTVEALKNNELATVSDLIVYSDGPKTDQDENKVSEVRNYIRSIEGFKSIRIIEQGVNCGLANSVIQGVTDTVNKYGKVIVLEDDLVTSPYFLRYMNDSLVRYENESKVMQVSGYMFPVEFDFSEDAFFLPFTTSWGWATWQRAWQHFDPDAAGYQQLKKNRESKNSFNLGGAYPYFRMLESQLRGEIDSWAIRWYLSVFVNQGIVLFPQKTLVINNGFDGSGTHCNLSSNWHLGLSCTGIDSMPESVGINHDAYNRIIIYLSSFEGSRLSNSLRCLINRFRYVAW